MLRKLNTKLLGAASTAVFVLCLSQIGYAQANGGDLVDESKEVGIDQPGPDQSDAGRDSPDVDDSSNQNFAGQCNDPARCSGGRESAELSPREEAEAIDNGWSN